MIILGIESSGGISSICLSDGCGLLAEYHFAHNMGLLRRLSPGIEELVHGAGLEMGGIGGIGVSLGPGSFTGLRIGITCAKALAFALGIPVAGVPTLKALAKNIGYIRPGSLVCSMIFARADEVYWCLFDSGLQELCEYRIESIDSLLRELEQRPEEMVFAGSGCRKHREQIEAALGSRAGFADPACDFARGLSVNALALERLEAGDSDDPALLVPMYIKKPTPVLRKEAREAK
ncbi:MAG: tRNA (adenosine(37)-N6)-threonylcarbamoyltransferase complex dimerization subunit type 1 TsaB [Abditibacteriota bacterium]|nr:tRNA (adenosine(37)-N6)-threonylcarbamoyltransferase complex dimerization subunit type 1 TsaB [Abditibacteriota bacterium]